MEFIALKEYVYILYENAQTTNSKEEFLLFVANVEKECLQRYLDIIGIK